MICAQNPSLALGTREDRETRIGIDRGFFLCTVEKMPKKKARRNQRGGLNPSFGRVEETGQG
jgi:hypothetical protein